MIIRLSKFEAVIALSLVVLLSFAFALKSEDKSVTASTAAETAVLPVLMYHNITKNSARAGRYTVTEDEFITDLEYIRDKGYTAVTVSELEAFVNGNASLPEKPIMITFDDGFESFYVIAYPLLRQYGMKAVVSVIGSVTEKYSSIDDHNISYSNLTWQEIIEMRESGCVEFQNHSYNMHNNQNGQRKGISKLKGESESEYKAALTADLYKSQELFYTNCGFRPAAVAYPYGAKSKSTLSIIKECGFICTLGCEEKTNTVTVGDSECLFNLGRYNRASGIATAEFFEKII